jgi:hypothetical protein
VAGVPRAAGLLERGAQARRRQPQAVTAGADAAADRPLRCLRCGHLVTREAARIRIGGSHEHGFVNPAGVSFHIGCFREAPGCAPRGEPSDEHTWFPGHSWRVAFCRGCGVHLGWAFSAPGTEGFYGLVLGAISRSP